MYVCMWKLNKELTLIYIGQDCVAEGNQFEEPCYILDSMKGETPHHVTCYDTPQHTTLGQSCLHISIASAHWLVLNTGCHQLLVIEHEVFILMRIPLQVHTVLGPFQLWRSVTFMRVGEEGEGRWSNA